MLECPRFEPDSPFHGRIKGIGSSGEGVCIRQAALLSIVARSAKHGILKPIANEFEDESAVKMMAHVVETYVACHGDGTTWLPGGWDHRGALLRMALGVVWVKPAGSVALPVGRAFDDQGVGVGGQSVDR